MSGCRKSCSNERNCERELMGTFWALSGLASSPKGPVSSRQASCGRESMSLVTSGLAPQPRAPTLGLKCPSLLCIPSYPQIPGRAKGQRCSRDTDRCQVTCLSVSLRPSIRRVSEDIQGPSQSHSSPAAGACPTCPRTPDS